MKSLNIDMFEFYISYNAIGTSIVQLKSLSYSNKVIMKSPTMFLISLLS